MCSSLNPSWSPRTLKNSPSKSTFSPLQMLLTMATYSLILLSGLVSATGKRLWPIRGMVGKLPSPSPRMVRPPDSSESVANVDAVVTGCLVKVLVTPDATRILEVEAAMEEM